MAATAQTNRMVSKFPIQNSCLKHRCGYFFVNLVRLESVIMTFVFERIREAIFVVKHRKVSSEFSEAHFDWFRASDYQR